jgi:methyl-accepting chemotaxis protein
LTDVTDVSVLQPSRRIAMPFGIVTVGCAIAIAVADFMLRQVLPDNLNFLLPVLAAGSGTYLAWRLAGVRRETPAGKALHCDRVDAAERDPSGDIVSPTLAPLHDAGVSRAVLELGQYRAFTCILKKQMNSVAELSEEAAGSILANLTGVDTKITALLSFIQQSGSNDHVVGLVAQIESQMQSSRQLLERQAARQDQDAQTGSQQRSKIVTDANDMLEVLAKLSGISRQTTMLSFNVSIEAARMGDASRGFSIIALEIRKLSSEVQTLSRDMHSSAKALMHSVTVDLKEQAEQRELAERDATATIRQALSALTDNLMTLIAHQRDILHKVESESASIAKPIMDIMGNVQFQDIIRQQLGQLGQMTDMVGDHIHAIGVMLGDPKAALGEETLSQKLDGMFSSYVMAGQREIHMAARGQSAVREAVSLIEMF